MTQIHQQRTMLCIFDFVFFRDQQANSKSQHNITWTPEVIADLIDARKEARRRKKVWEGMFLKTEFREIDFMEKILNSVKSISRKYIFLKWNLYVKLRIDFTLK